MSDPVADFLAREQDVLAGIEDASLEVNGAIPDASAQPGAAGFNDFAQVNGLGDSGVDLTALDQSNAVHLQRRLTPNATPSPVTVNQMPKIEPEKIRKWREEQKEMLEKKDKAEEKKKEEMRAAAKKELDEWYAQRAEQLAKTKIANRKAEQEMVAERDSVQNGAEWERIAKLCEFNAKSSKNSTDVSRLRSLMLQLKTRKE